MRDGEDDAVCSAEYTAPRALAAFSINSANDLLHENSLITDYYMKIIIDCIFSALKRRRHGGSDFRIVTLGTLKKQGRRGSAAHSKLQHFNRRPAQKGYIL